MFFFLGCLWKLGCCLNWKWNTEWAGIRNRKHSWPRQFRSTPKKVSWRPTQHTCLVYNSHTCTYYMLIFFSAVLYVCTQYLKELKSCWVSIHQWQQLLHCLVQRANWLPHNGVHRLKLLPAIRHPSHHRTQRCSLGGGGEEGWNPFYNELSLSPPLTLTVTLTHSLSHSLPLPLTHSHSLPLTTVATNALALPPPGAEVLAPNCSIKERTELLTRGPSLVAPILYLQTAVCSVHFNTPQGDIQKATELSVKQLSEWDCHSLLQTSLQMRYTHLQMGC